MRRKSLARRVRFHAGWLAILMMLLEAISSVWFAFDQIFPISPMVYAGLGLFFAVASGIGHLYRND